jgi:AGCS family alanine or glycine:cation symporter
VAEKLVPIAAAAYLLLGSLVLIIRIDAIPAAFSSIIQGAFSPKAATGGVIGSLITTLRTGVSRGVFTNEAGMGTAGIAHGSANVKHPIDQGLMGIMEVFLDTIVICTMTALVILCSGVDIPYGIDVGVSLTTNAFSAVLGDWVKVFITLALCLFAFATVLGWGLYGARCAQFLFGRNVWKKFAWLQAVTAVIGALLNTGTVWLIAETVNGLMAIPNLIALAVLSPELSRLILDYKQKTGKIAGGGTLCKYPSTQTAVSPLPCGNSIPSQLLPKSREKRSTT